MLRLRFMGWQALFGLLFMLLAPTGALAQSFAVLSCPTLVELRMEMLVRYGFCPRERFYAKLFSQQAQGCDAALSEFQVQGKILNDASVPPEDKARLTEILRQIQKKNCQI